MRTGRRRCCKGADGGVASWGRFLPVVACLLLWSGGDPAAAQTDTVRFVDRPLDDFVVRAVRVPRPPKIDGVLDDSCWSMCAGHSGFTQMRPNQEAPATESTVCYFAYDDHRFYFAARCFDSAPDKVRANVSRREDIGGDDLIELLLDTYNDQRSSYCFDLNPLGIQADGIMTAAGSDYSWDAIWNSAGTITDDGWQVEMAIPFKVLRFPKQQQQTWRVQVFRLIRETGEFDAYVPFRKVDNSELARMAELRGIELPSMPVLLDVIPYVTGSHNKFETPRERDKVRFGSDLKYGLGPNLILDGTVNPDFGNVEADVDYINLSPYELYLQEKRPFFLERMDIFETPMSLFYSRRVADPEDGARLTGRLGPYGVGLFYAKDNNKPLDHRDDYVVARLERNIMSQSHLGGMMTYVKGRTHENTVLAGDFRMIRNSVSVSGQVAQGRRPGQESNNYRGTANLGFNRNNLALSYDYSFHERNFHADAGFISPLVIDLMYTPISYRTNRLTADYQLYVNRHHLQSVGAHLSGTLQHAYGGRPLTRQVSSSLSFSFDRNLGFAFGPTFDDKRWEGRMFNMATYFLSAWANPSGLISSSVYYEEGRGLDYWNVASVWQRYLSVDLSINPSKKLELIPSVYHISQYQSQHGRRTYNQWNWLLRTGYHFNKNMFMKVFVQGNTQADWYTANFLFGFTFLPGTTLYLAYNSDYLDIGRTLVTKNSIVFTKISFFVGT